MAYTRAPMRAQAQAAGTEGGAYAAGAVLEGQRQSTSANEAMEVCVFGHADVDNHSDPGATMLSVTSSGDAQLVRLLGWVIDGLELEYTSAEIEHSSELTRMKMHIVYRHSQTKLSDADASLLSEQVADACRYCKPMVEPPSSFAVTRGAFCISTDDTTSSECSEVVVDTSYDLRNNKLVELATTVTGSGCSIKRAQFVDSCWHFDVVNARGQPLVYQEATGMLWILERIHRDTSSSLLVPPL